MVLKLEKESFQFGGCLKRYSHLSNVNNCIMHFTIFLPPAVQTGPVPTLYWLSGLTSTDENFSIKAGAQAEAARLGLAIVMPDTSPRDAGIPGESNVWNVGTGAGFYLNATHPPWSRHYRMYDYIVDELPTLVESEFRVIPGLCSISGFSMGGHGALVISLRNPGRFASVSALAPICHPIEAEIAREAFTAYLGDDSSTWRAYDATCLVNDGTPFTSDILVDQGSADSFLLDGNLKVDEFSDACRTAGLVVTINMRHKYGHDYYFVSTFIAEHLRFHHRALMKRYSPLPVKQPVSTALPIHCKAAVAWAPRERLWVEDVQVAPPRKGEVRLQVLASSICHTDLYTLAGADPEGVFPCILGHEAACIVESVGEDVSLAVGDYVIPSFSPQCHNCEFCTSGVNQCCAVRSYQGRGVMSDSTSRFTCNGQPIYHFMGCSTFSEYTVVAEISCAKISPKLSPAKACLLSCGVSTGLGAVWNSCKVRPGESVVVFGLGPVGLAAIQAAKAVSAHPIVGIDINRTNFPLALSLGATVCLDSTAALADFVGPWGSDYSIDCTGDVSAMRDAFEAVHRGGGVSCIVGVAGAGEEIKTRPFNLITGRKWIGSSFGGWRLRSDIPRIVERVVFGEIVVDHFVSEVLQGGVHDIAKAVDLQRKGSCLRVVVEFF